MAGAWDVLREDAFGGPIRGGICRGHIQNLANTLLYTTVARICILALANECHCILHPSIGPMGTRAAWICATRGREVGEQVEGTVT
jgi:hypothetical protein